ncbi:MAG TPA: hypothetical protein VF747_11815 [Blastocatellia bacterium]|jgi:hypothetical protein
MRKQIQATAALIAARSISYLKAKLGPRASREVQAECLAICNPCEFKATVGKNDYCSACGCPMSGLWPDAKLERKAALARATCPMNSWVQ